MRENSVVLWVRWMPLVMALMVSVLGSVEGAPLLGTDNFDDGLAHGWEMDPGGSHTTDGVQLTGGNPNGYYQVYFGATTLPDEQVDYLFNHDENHIGDYSDKRVSFDFWVSPVSAPAVALNVYFVSGSSVWYHEFTVPANHWTGVTVGFSQSEWTGGVDFLTDVANVTEIGIQLHHFNNNNSEFTYGLDNWSVTVPEPESVALAVTVLLSLAITFRTNIRPCLAKIPFCGRFTPNP